MNPDSADNISGSVKKFTRIMVFIAIGFVALYVFIFMQLKQTESQLTSYGNVTNSAIGNFLESLPESDTVKIEKTVEGISFVVKGGEGSSLNSDLLDSKDSTYYLNATNIQEGTLKNAAFSAWSDLEAEGITANGKIKQDYLPTLISTNGTVTLRWEDIQNRPSGLDNGDDVSSISEEQVETYITNSGINLASGTTINNEALATQTWVTSQNYLTGISFSQIANGTGVFLDYRPNNLACTEGQVLKYDAALNHWICGTDSGAGAVAWGDINGNLADQTDLNSALTNKLGTTASFGGDVSGTYDTLTVANDSHDHTGATISGLTTADFTSPNISQWTNNAGYITDDTSVPKNNLTNTGTLGFTWATTELTSTVMVEGENISLLNNNAGFITGVTYAQVTNGTGVYSNYKPNNVACNHDQTLKYDAALTRWACADDIGTGSTAWGTITGTLSSQGDLSTALSSKLNLTASFGGDVSGTYDNLAISNDSHAHTGATISGLAASNFTSANISQWTNDSGFITGVDISQIANGAGKYSNYKPNNVACSNGQILEYDSANTRWICGTDDTGTGGGTSGGGELVIIADNVSAAGATLNDTFNFTTATSGDFLLYVSTTLYVSSANHVVTLVATVDGNVVGNSSMWLNQASVHTTQQPIVVKLTNLTAGAHTLNVSATGAHTVDVNDKIHAYVMAKGGTTGVAVNAQQASGTTDISTTSTSLVDMTDMSITMTTAGNPIEISFSAGVGHNTTNGIGVYQLVLDGTPVGTASKVRVPSVTVGSNTNLIWTATPASGSHTIKVQWKSEAAGTVYNRAAAGNEHRTLIVKEFLGGNGSGGTVTVGSMTGTSVFSTSTADDDWLGLGASAGRIEFDDQTTDEINLLDANVGIGLSAPTHKLDVNGNIGLAVSAYLNFGSTDGTAGYGLRDNAGVIEAKNSTGAWAPVVTDAPIDGKSYVRKDAGWVELSTNDPAWSNSSIKWFVGGTEVTLDASSKQRYKVNNGVVTILANLVATPGVNLSGSFEIRNLPLIPQNASVGQVLGNGEWRNEQTNYYTTRLLVSDAVNGYLIMRRYDTYQTLSDTVNGTQTDAISFAITYETNQAGSTIASNFAEQVTVPVIFPITSSGSWTKGVDTNQLTYNRIYNVAQNAYVEWGIPLGAGSWKLELLGQKGPNRGIGTVTLDGVSVGTLDQYNGSYTSNDIFTITGIPVAVGGNKRLRITIATKNGSSADYVFPISMIVLSKE